VTNFLYKYGSFTHEVGSVTDFTWKHRAHNTQRGQRDISLYRITLSGSLLCMTGNTWQEIRDKILALRTAYLTNDLKFSLINPDGTDSSYRLDPFTDPAILKGPYVAEVDFPTGTIEEMLVKREWKVVLECLRLEPESQIIEYEETVKHYGSPYGAWASALTLQAVRQYITQFQSTKLIVQEGRSVGLEGYYATGWWNGWPTFAIPVISDPLLQHMERKEEHLGKPILYPPSDMTPRLNRKFLYYPGAWKYVYEVADDRVLQPT
jgi:hypothetical protein